MSIPLLPFRDSLTQDMTIHWIYFQNGNEVIVDHACGMAVLRGANIFAQGIMSAPMGMYNIQCIIN